jgi:hypothetical protein
VLIGFASVATTESREASYRACDGNDALDGFGRKNHAAKQFPITRDPSNLSQHLLGALGFVPEGSGGLLTLRLARREERGLIYVGRVGTGWDRKTARAIRHALEPLARPTAPLAKPLKKVDTTWVEPRFDAEIAHAEITDDGMVRHPSFKRLVP